jgi:hypothetical protein
MHIFMKNLIRIKNPLFNLFHYFGQRTLRSMSECTRKSAPFRAPAVRCALVTGARCDGTKSGATRRPGEPPTRYAASAARYCLRVMNKLEAP